ncbi:AAA family ATPase [Candidatus Dojkabacteria bacterium]|uniref:AAA family ATPase n=1 Tax=Candidatus Dojkabacteria bacterium TaxID=2099670 RepID=A0A955HY49_9BACT|nr:AAA family ATPase [Candidatus Dojkabacteria bacterium]MCB9790672.1 AAA family ATPase [Candidatus Nomurabacteria bacterium]
MEISFTEDFAKAMALLDSDLPAVMITGKAGSGKSTLLKYFRENTDKNLAIVAPTGVAALNVQGETIHSFFRFKPNTYLEDIKAVRDRSLYKELHTLVVDEVSMLRVDLLDAIDRFLRINRGKKDIPFGGVRMVFFGDLYQLPPVVTREDKETVLNGYRSPYFFENEGINQLGMKVFTLEKVFRQEEGEFLSALNRVRTGKFSDDDLDLLNQRVESNFDPDYSEGVVYLTVTNAIAQEINEYKLNELITEEVEFNAEVTGEFNTSACPAEEKLLLKAGAQVMFLSNDPEKKWVNGSIGRVLDVYQNGEENIVSVALSSGEIVEVASYTWENYKYVVNQDGKVSADKIGTFRQLPLKLAWAVTIHKSQGKTFEKVYIDLGNRAFAHGQVYVALSRCPTLAGIQLKRPIRSTDIIVDSAVRNWSESHSLE